MTLMLHAAPAGSGTGSAPMTTATGTPTGADLKGLTTAYGMAYARVGSADELTAALREPPRGLRVVEVPVDRTGHRALRARLREAAERATATVADPPPPPPGRPDRDYPERGMRT